MSEEKIFGTDGIRDIANQGYLTPKFLTKLGRILGLFCHPPLRSRSSGMAKDGWTGKGKSIGKVIYSTFTSTYPRVIIGRDTRPSGQTIENALTTGLLSIGVDVVKAGIISTPGLAYLTTEGKYAMGIMISASHNPAHYNGVKLFASSGMKLTASAEQEIEKYLRLPAGKAGTGAPVQPVNRFGRPVCVRARTGRVVHIPSDRLREKYIHYLLNTVFNSETPLCPRPVQLKFHDAAKTERGWAKELKIVVDCANGALCGIAPAVFARAGACLTGRPVCVRRTGRQVRPSRIIAIYSDAEGHQINDGCGSLYPAALRRKVLATKADIGFSFDGDGDRVILVDEKGVIRDGDSVLYAAAKYFKKHHLLENNTVVGTIMTNSALETLLAKEHIKLVRTPVGDKYVLLRMLKDNFSIGGEPSGHIIFKDYSKNGDGLITALMMLKIMHEEKKSLAELTSSFKPYPQLIVNVPVKSKPPLEQIKPIQAKVKKIDRILNEAGRLNIRYSGTEALVRIMIEGRNLRFIESLANELAKIVEDVLG